MEHAGKIAAGLCSLGGAAFIAMQFSGNTRTEPLPEEVKGSKLKKSLSNAGLYPEPGTKKLAKMHSGDMAVFTGQQTAAEACLVKDGGKVL
mmetsp:Transcript_37557/g.87810  ORF Transcript_37557/g.87810 Transcript_37557/m.87810 type:complete len:91 (-) Transcript_37557:484-756(-)|eukprot:CAMPEP_0119378162 /NCGR_PEP_ID=MMETSP1334-20130426/47439_1 /TAXON_ID=127549 /ORGANISM="Calcidiscus leptoporus, Strain RCC1130" /LENGTH=90 /DNA_ID=CAMNT_0007397283 /DNA_START=24 /DNA_END=296 /DNA_ORIENTATION=+